MDTQIQTHFRLNVFGHSMAPKYPPGSIVFYKPADVDLIFWGEDYVVELADRKLVRRLQKSDRAGYIQLCCYNQTYPSTEIPVSKIRSLHQVVCKINLETSI